MAVPQRSPRPVAEGGERVADFSLVVSTANGTGSQTANLALLRSFFRLGVPVHGKNVFPSNIQGLPTWYHIRTSADGWVARQEPEILVAYNPATLHEDVGALPAGGVLILNDDLRGAPERDDVATYRIPVKELMADVQAPPKLRSYLANMTYLGVVAWLLRLPLEVVETALDQQFGGRRKLVDANLPLVQSSYRWAEASLDKHDPFRVEAMSATDGLLLMTGNEAAALGAVFGGASFAAWYPITPSTSLVDALRGHLAELRTDADGRARYTVMQAEDELAALGMVIGAGWAGARAMTSTSGPGLSLMAEFTGLGYFAEVPAVIWDVQRVGPSTGLPTRTAQGDLAFAYRLGHGDTRHPLLLPSSIEECFEFGWSAFDVADELQTPVFVLSDLDLGMNTWMGRPFDYPDRPMRRGKVLRADEIPAGYGRYRDVDGDGIAPRTLPGDPNPEGAYFARGTGHDDRAVYSERPEHWRQNAERLRRKHETARRILPAPVLEAVEGAELLVIAFGSTRWAIEEARAHLAAEQPAFSFLRVRALPAHEAVAEAIRAHERTVVVEMNRDGQLAEILRAELPELAPRIASIAYLDGLPFTAVQVAEWLRPHLRTREGRAVAAGPGGRGGDAPDGRTPRASASAGTARRGQEQRP